MERWNFHLKFIVCLINGESHSVTTYTAIPVGGVRCWCVLDERTDWELYLHKNLLVFFSVFSFGHFLCSFVFELQLQQQTMGEFIYCIHEMQLCIVASPSSPWLFHQTNAVGWTAPALLWAKPNKKLKQHNIWLTTELSRLGKWCKTIVRLPRTPSTQHHHMSR